MGSFIVVEGIDGSGIQTQCDMLKKYFDGKIPTLLFSYPEYNKPIGSVIRNYLDKEVEFSPATLTLLNTADKIKDNEKIAGFRKNGMVIAERWFTSVLAYQGLSFPLERIRKLGDLFYVQKPDIIIFLDISVDTSLKRKLKENGRLDRYEEDRKLLEKARDAYQRLAKDNSFGKWVVLDGEKPKEDVFDNVLKALKIIKSLDDIMKFLQR